jgi:hypothetical protein
MNTAFDYIAKKQIIERINQLSRKSDFINVFNIIKKYNKNLNFSENENGIYIMFHNLSNETYSNLNKYLNDHLLPNQDYSKFIEHVENYNMCAKNNDTEVYDSFTNAEKDIMKQKYVSEMESDKNVTYTNNIYNM